MKAITDAVIKLDEAMNNKNFKAVSAGRFEKR